MALGIVISICFTVGAGLWVAGLVVGYWIGRSDAGR